MGALCLKCHHRTIPLTVEGDLIPGSGYENRKYGKAPLLYHNSSFGYICGSVSKDGSICQCREPTPELHLKITTYG